MKVLEIIQKRKPEYPVDDIFLSRWSPRAMSGEEMTTNELMALFEAAKWAPSSYNNQHWRFIYAKRNTPHWDVLFNLLVDLNKVWAKNAAALVVIVSKNTFDRDGKPARTHTFDTGAAWENLALQASMSDWVAHGMQGFDYERAQKDLGIPEGYTVEAMAAIGRPGNKEDLPPDVQKMESPSGRKKLSEIVFEGKFKS